MSEVSNNKYKSSHLSCIDIYGKGLIVSQTPSGKIQFAFHHDEILEGTARKEFEDLSLSITSESEMMFQIAKGLYEMVGNELVLSDDPIRDGRNYFFLKKDSSGSYSLTFVRDLANELNLPDQTNVEISGRPYEMLYHDVVEGKTLQLSRKTKLPQ